MLHPQANSGPPAVEHGQKAAKYKGANPCPVSHPPVHEPLG